MPITAIGIERLGACVSSAIDAAISKPMNRVTANSTPLKTSPIEVCDGSNTDSVLPFAPPSRITATEVMTNGIAERNARARTPRIAMRTPKWLSPVVIARLIRPQIHQSIEIESRWVAKKPSVRKPSAMNTPPPPRNSRPRA